MIPASMLVLAAACIGSPMSPEEQETSGPSPSGSELVVAPATVWLWPGDSETLSARLTEDGVEREGVSFTWKSSNPGVVDVGDDGRVVGKGTGTAKISVTGGGIHRDGAVTVTVSSDQAEAEMAAIFNIPRLEPVWAQLPYSPRYDELFEKYGDDHFDRSGGEWELTYYDRGLAWYGGWWRYGDTRYMERGHTDVLAYRDDYVLPNNGRVTPKWVFPEGLALHYLITGDSKSREAVVKMANEMVSAGWLDNMMETQYRDGRIQGRTILAQIIAFQLTGNEVFRERSARGIDNLVEWYESSGGNGSWDHPTRTDVDYCGGMATFQIAHAILEAMIRYHDLIDADPRIPPIVEASLDYSWTFWEPGQGFAYIQPPESFTGDLFQCERSGTNKPAGDVSLLIATTFAEAYRLTGEERFRTRGDEVLEYGLSGAIYLQGYKQFNQSFMRSYRYLYHTN